jgi:hypothetical protein
MTFTPHHPWPGTRCICRLAILTIKDVWHRLPVYPYEVEGIEIYDVVLEHGERTPDDFAMAAQDHRLIDDTCTCHPGSEVRESPTYERQR